MLREQKRRDYTIGKRERVSGIWSRLRVRLLHEARIRDNVRKMRRHANDLPYTVD